MQNTDERKRSSSSNALFLRTKRWISYSVTPVTPEFCLKTARSKPVPAVPRSSRAESIRTGEDRRRRDSHLLAAIESIPPNLFRPSWCIRPKGASALAEYGRRLRSHILAKAGLHCAEFRRASDTQSHLAAFFVFQTREADDARPRSRARCNEDREHRPPRHPRLQRCGMGSWPPAATIDRRCKSFQSERRRLAPDDRVPS